jgi:T5SS/PEP-CTERM-associated repeat protein
LETNDGKGHIIISGNATVNVGDDLELANEPTGVGTVDISGTATVTITDDIDLGKKGVGTLNISGDATLHVPDELYIGDDGGSEGHLNISGNATVEVVDDIDVGDNGLLGTLDISENATVHVVDSIKIAENGGPGHMTVSGTATVNVDDDIEPGCSPGIGTLDISENATVILGDDFELGVDAGGEGHLTVSGNASVTCDDLFVGKDLDSITSLTINGGETICGDDLHMGNSGGADIGQSRVFMNGGMLQAEGLNINITDSQIVYTGGLFGIGSADVNEAGMQQLITDGTIVVDVVDGVYSIATTGDGYTVLNPWAASLPKIPKPADGAEGVLLGTTLSWGAGDTAATHDVYFGTTSPPALIGNQEAAAYYPGPIELGTTYYWQVVEVEADGVTKHASDVWSFTTTTDLSTVSEIATQPDLADGTDGVSIEGTTLSWWPGASAVSHDVYFGTTSPPALAGNQVEMSFDSGGLKPSTTYYWQVDAVEADGTTKHTGDIWSFTTESGNAMEPDPADGATDIPKMVTLSWMPGLTAASHDVYFGDSIPPAFIGNQTETSYSPATLVKGKTYYWQVDAVEADGTTKYTGDVWSFTVTTAGR